ncbi:MAG: class I SAM-dependent methyltransferase [Vicinamibacterales bacterium]
MLETLKRTFRALRRKAARWSVGDDRAFHDALFSAHLQNPFSLSYPGYITIRRFADLADPHVAKSRSVLDLGCGPGEITCELAARHSDVAFIGVDHSVPAIELARENAARRRLSNASFVAADISLYAPSAPVDLVIMFDAFHHLVDPGLFIRSASSYSSRFFLIEPAGDELGRWRRTLDFDWLVSDLDTVATRIGYSLDETRGAAHLVSAQSREDGRAIENRYPECDYRRFFRDFAVDFRGTVAGVDRYPPAAGESFWRDRAMELAYEFIVSIDDELFRRSLDLYGKHWAIYADRNGIAGPQRHTPTRPVVHTSPDTRLQGAFDAAYADVEMPRTLHSLNTIVAEVTITNLSWREWRSDETARPIMVSYHWLDRERRPVEYDGLRTPFPRPIPPGASARLAVRVEAPRQAGEYILEIDLVEEGVSWFSAAGVPPLRISVRVF